MNSVFPGIEANPKEIDLNVMEEAIASIAQKIIMEKKKLRVEIVPSLPQMLTPAFYMSGELLPEAFVFGQVVPAAIFFVVGVDSKLQATLEMDSSWIIETIENAWREFFPNICCRLGNWDHDLSKVRRLPSSLNLRFLRYSVFCERDGRTERAGYFDILGKYMES